VTCTIYGRENDLLEFDGWNHFKAIAWREGKYICQVNQAKLCSYHTAPHYK
jgi:hypothetical protein